MLKELFEVVACLLTCTARVLVTAASAAPAIELVIIGKAAASSNDDAICAAAGSVSRGSEDSKAVGATTVCTVL